MPRCPAKDYPDRCTAVQLSQKHLTRREIGAMLQRPERWVYRALARYDAQVGLTSLRDYSSRPHHSPRQTPADIEQAICAMKQAHPVWGRRQICKQLRWQWRDEPALRDALTEGRVRRVLHRHPEFAPPAPGVDQPAPRRIDYLACNLLWGADTHQSRLADGSTWETLHWLDLHSRYELGQVTAAHLTEEMVVESFLRVANQYGLPQVIKTDGDKLFYEPTSGLPTLFQRVAAAVGVVHLPIVGRQPWWNGVVERYIQTCQQEVQLPTQGDAEAMNRAMEAERLFYDQERCHSRCADQPPATVYQPSPRRLPPDFSVANVPLTLLPTVVTRQVQASGRVSVAGHSYFFSRRYAGQALSVSIDGWQATAQAADGWQRTWDLRHQVEVSPPAPQPAPTTQPLTRTVNRRGCISFNRRLYYLGIAWVGQTLPLEPQGKSWTVRFPDGSSKTILDPQLLSVGPRKATQRLQTPPSQQPEAAAFQIRRVTHTGQVAFHHRLYYVGIAHRGQHVCVAPAAEGLAVYTMEQAWITTCPWKTEPEPDKPLCPT